MSDDDTLTSDLARTAVVAADTRLPERYLVIRGGRLDGRRFRIHKSRMVIGAAGRGATNEIALDLPTLSAQHAAIEIRPTGIVHVHDLNSSNGTFINDETVPPGSSQLVGIGDEVSLGPDLTFELVGPSHTEGTDAPAGHRSSSTSHQTEAGSRRPRGSTTSQAPPRGISSDVPLGRILGYLISGAIVSCTIFGLLNDTLDLMGIVQSIFGGKSGP